MAEESHTLAEDLAALVTGTLFFAFGIHLCHQVGLLTGGTAGLALLLTHLMEVSFGQVFFLINLPFYWLAWRQMGWRFCLNTFASVALVALLADYAEWALTISRIEPLFAGVFGGICMGIGMLILFRHRSSLGGLGILALYLQSRLRISAGKFQMGVDCAILLASFFIVSLPVLGLSVLGAIALNLVITMNHKPGRYQIT